MFSAGGGIGFGGAGEARPEEPESPKPPAPESPPEGTQPEGPPPPVSLGEPDQLMVRQGKTVGQVYPLAVGDTLIGRNVPPVVVDVDLTDQETGDRYTVSRHHAVISRQAGACTIRDLGSKFGTKVNDRAIAPPATGALGEAVALVVGDRLVLGCVELEVTHAG